jgi:hypothetical protein
MVNVRTTTLAGEIFSKTPQLKETAQQTHAYEALSARKRDVNVDGATYAVLEGDLLYDDDELSLYALQQASREEGGVISPMAQTPLEPAPALVGISAGSRIIRWAPGKVLGYAVNRDSFPSRQHYDAVREAMASAAEAWEGTCGIAFNHFSQHDQHSDPATTPSEIDPSLVFVVRYIDAGGQFIAAAFFPTYPPKRRRVLIDPSYFADDLGFDPVGVLRHELGHVLGFRHEHIRSGAPALCPQEQTTDVVDLTAYDPQSVMHYFCGGVGSRDLKITDLDRQGAQKLYGPPLSSLQLVE